MYFIDTPHRYNWGSEVVRTPAVQSALELVKSHHADNFGWALACCAWDSHSAEDVLQEAYLRVLDGRAKFGGKSSAKTWFFAVIKRVASDVKRTQTRRSVLNLRVLAGDIASLAEQRPTQSAVYAQESAQQLQSALMLLSVRQREVLHLVFYSELSVEESAQALRISVGSARTHYQRGKVRLAQLLTQEEANE
ncbi:MAG: RNA polymerase sigma factor (sigma-70 family) [Halioglobus sp.]|jgi:RNA polymerase sigma factor (sigma-70 family)